MPVREISTPCNAVKYKNLLKNIYANLGDAYEKPIDLVKKRGYLFKNAQYYA